MVPRMEGPTRTMAHWVEGAGGREDRGADRSAIQVTEVRLKVPRALTGGMLAAITSPSWSPAIFVSIQFAPAASAPNPVLVWSGYQSITTSLVTGSSATFTGLGALLSLTQVEEGSTVNAHGLNIELSGLDPTIAPDALADYNLGLPVTVWLAAMSGGAPIANPVVLWSGVTDEPQFNIGADAVTLRLACENLLVSMNVPVDRRYTPQDQAMNWPGDNGLSFVYQIVDINITWGTTVRASAAARSATGV